MIKFSSLFILLLVAYSSFGQSKSTNSINLPNKPADHFMIQLANNYWSGTPDSVSSYQKSFNRSANVYVMLNKPFKNNEKLSIGVGVGIGTSSMNFKNLETRIGSTTPLLPFVRTDTGNHYSKYKLTTAYLEVPLELRFTATPSNVNKSWKGALGIKVGTLINAHTKGKNLVNVTGNKLNSNTVKESSKSYFNTTRIAATARVGYGIISLFGSYNVSGIFKDAVAADIKPFQIGISISGL